MSRQNGKQELNNSQAKFETSKDNFKIYLSILKVNIIPIVIIFLVCVIVTVFYVINAKDIFKSSTSILIQKPQGSLLSSNIIPGLQDFANDRFVSNEIEILKSYTIRKKAADALLDSFNVSNEKNRFYFIINQKKKDALEPVSSDELTEGLAKIVTVEQKRGLDIVTLEVEDPSKYEAKLIANAYANAYLNYNLEFNKKGLKNISNYLVEIKDKKLQDLNNSEAALQDFQQRGNIVFLDDQASSIVEQIATLEAEKNASEVELTTSRKTYDALKGELEKIDPQLITYIESQVTQSYIDELQKKIAQVEAERDIELTIPKDKKLIERVQNEYAERLNLLSKTLNDKIDVLKQGVYAGTPEQRREIAQQLLLSNIKIQSSNAKFNSLKGLLGKYEVEFAKLPAQAIELAKLERNKKADEKLFLLLEEKYQEAIINEKSLLGNVSIIDPAFEALKPTKPHRMFILITGCIFGVLLGIGYAMARNYFDRTIKSPEDIESKGVTLLAWIPSIADLKASGSSSEEFFVANNPKSSESESFKALRTRIQFAKLDGGQLKTILVTSSIPSEGKTTVALNLAGSFALSDNKVLLIDCDLRKPRVHSVFEAERFPGLSDYLFGNVQLDDIIKPTKIPTLSYITSGTIPPNPSELLGSKQMLNLIEHLKTLYDYVIIDSPPFISVTDSEILSRITDGTALVVLANKTPIDVFMKSCERLHNMNPHNFLGVVLNNFSYKNVYGYYYNYYYYYAKPEASGKIPSKVK
jgi:capsular exopolysaccharide synthesis family protein